MDILRITRISAFGALWVCMPSAMADGGVNPLDLEPEHWLMLLGTVGFAVAGIFLFNVLVFVFFATHVALIVLLIIRLIWKIKFKRIAVFLLIILALFYIAIAGMYLDSRNSPIRSSMALDANVSGLSFLGVRLPALAVSDHHEVNPLKIEALIG